MQSICFALSKLAIVKVLQKMLTMGLLSNVFYAVCVYVSLLASGLCQTELTDADKQTILDAHNRYRSNVDDPSAANMERMVKNYSTCSELLACI